MMKLLGALLVVCACTAAGLEKSFSLRRRVRSLSALLAALSMLREGMCKSLVPIPELVRRLCVEAPSPADALFSVLRERLAGIGEKPLSVIWRDGVMQSGEALLLRGEELETLAALGLGLGGGSDEQARAIDVCEARLADFLTQAQQEARERGRLYSTLGVAAGLLLAVVLI